MQPKEKTVYRIQYKNSDGAKMFQFGLDDSLPDDQYVVKIYGAHKNWPQLSAFLDSTNKVELDGTDMFLERTATGKGMCYVKCSMDSFYKLKARYQ